MNTEPVAIGAAITLSAGLALVGVVVRSKVTPTANT